MILSLAVMAAQVAEGVHPGTARMAALLRQRAAAIKPMDCGYLADARAETLAAQIAETSHGLRRGQTRIRRATELLNAGRPEEALSELDLAAADSAGNSADAIEARHDVERLRILTWLRIGELENCLANHCCTSCIAPIEPGGQHKERRGSEKAIELLMPALERSPDDDEYRWMLNLAHMTLGSWPDAVPERFRIGPERFASDHPLPRFADVAPQCGLAHSSISGGVCLEDFDRDGFLDVLVSSMGFTDQLRLFRSNGDGTFADRTTEAKLTGLTGGLNLVHADYDNDGFADVFVLRGAWLGDSGEFPNSLLRNRGDGTFEDVTEAAGMLTFHPTQTAAWADFDGDGWLDLVVGNETQPNLETQRPCELWHNQRDGTFLDVAARVGADVVGFVKGVAVGDYDNDGRPDVLYSRRMDRKVLLHNVPAPAGAVPGFRFVDTADEMNLSGPNVSFPAWFFDFDNDGMQDLLIAANAGFGPVASDGIGAFLAGRGDGIETIALYRNKGDRFIHVSKKQRLDRAILTMGSNYGDLDNDGWLDIVLGNGAPSLAALLPNKAFRNDRGNGFQDVTTAGGFGHLQKGHGVAFADLDNDGDQDVFCELGGFFPTDVYPSALFENPGNANHWITLRLEGVKANRSAIGARLRVDLVTPGGPRSVHLTCGTGGSFGSSSLQQEMGLGDATAIERIVIRWPGSGTVQELEGPPLDGCYRIREDATACEPVVLKKLKLGGGER
jgi:hypothetical protein